MPHAMGAGPAEVRQDQHGAPVALVVHGAPARARPIASVEPLVGRRGHGHLGVSTPAGANFSRALTRRRGAPRAHEHGHEPSGRDFGTFGRQLWGSSLENHLRRVGLGPNRPRIELGFRRGSGATVSSSPNRSRCPSSARASCKQRVGYKRGPLAIDDGHRRPVGAARVTAADPWRSALT